MLHEETTDKSVIVNEVVNHLIGFGRGETRPSVAEDVRRTSREFDRGTMRGYCKVLIEHLKGAPDSVGELDSLLVLGLAYPSLMGRHKIQIAQEGRRLAHLLEGAGDTERAQQFLEVISSQLPENRSVDKDLASMLRRTGNVDRLVDRYVRRAEEAMAEGRRRDAITWLREILLLDRSRSDIARMIRDLQYEEREQRLAWRRRVRLGALLFTVVALVVGVVFRELHIQNTYETLTPQVGEDRASLQLRLENLDRLINVNPLWLGMFQAGRERADLKKQIAELEFQAEEDALVAANALKHSLMQADAARTRGLLLLEQRDFAGAQREFARCLEVAPADWAQRARVLGDMKAISELSPDQIRALQGGAR